MNAEQIREAIAVYRESLQTIPLDDVEKVVLEAAEAHAANLERWEMTAPCNRCSGPHQFDTSIPSPLWNRVIRDTGLPDCLCTTCIVWAFVKEGVGFEAELYGLEVDRPDGIVPVIRVEVDGRPIEDSYGDLEHRLRVAEGSK
jgi:hypothetical protein